MPLLSHGVASYSVARSKTVASPVTVLIYRTSLGLVRSYDHGCFLLLFPSLAHPAGPLFTQTLSALVSTPVSDTPLLSLPSFSRQEGGGPEAKGLEVTISESWSSDSGLWQAWPLS